MHPHLRIYICYSKVAVDKDVYAIIECNAYHRRRISTSCWFRLFWEYAYSFWLCDTWETMTLLFSEYGGSLRAWDVSEHDVVKLGCKFSFATREKNIIHFASKSDKFLDRERRAFVLELSQHFGICSRIQWMVMRIIGCIEGIQIES